MEGFDILNLFFVLLSAWGAGALIKRIGYPVILGELLIGIIIGPPLLGLVETSSTLTILSEAGVILLMAYIGMEINFKDLGKASWAGLLAAIGGFVVPFALGYYVVTLSGGTSVAGLFVGIAVGVTSLATKSRILVDLNLLDTRIAYVLMAGALFSDTLALIIFAGLSSFIDAGSVNMTEIVFISGKIILFFLFATLFGLYLLPKLIKWLETKKIDNRTFYFTLLLLIVFGLSELAEFVGLHGILGAFMAGLFVKDDLFNKKISTDISNVFHDVSVGFMAPIFFVTAGFHVSLDVFQTDLNLLLLILAAAFIGKIVGTIIFYLPSGYGWREGLAVGTGMNGRGAVEIVIAGIGLQKGVITQEIFSILVFMAILTTLSVPLFLTWSTNWLKKRGELVKQYSKKGYLILGANPLGLLLGEHLKASDKITFIDANKVVSEQAETKGFKCIHGNVLEETTLTEASAKDYRTFIAITENTEINLLASQLANDNFYVPEKYVVICPNENKAGAGVSLLGAATTLFASRTDIKPWIEKIQSSNYKEVQVKITKETTTRLWVKSQLQKDKNMLPLVIIDTNGNKRPFGYNDSLEVRESVIYIE
ncbi:cation:proton antiporter [Aestuariibaculum sp. M13]|uniref:cation:proton antiporter n=1 Tax=Aestuariibaculum sp. M13 TaxID=2967132 RepID=UPI002159D70A|nr:cation:proton antiporter [Aestuariibaculum sp. M13]MCR8667269.1 cation:proton antiporter [Aestuariibaculum sp. M13]